MYRFFLLLSIFFPCLTYSQSIYFPFNEPVEAKFYFLTDDHDKNIIALKVDDHWYVLENLRHWDTICNHRFYFETTIDIPLIFMKHSQ